MGKASKWFRGLFGLKKPSSAGGGAGADSDRKPASSKRRWTFVKSCKNDTNSFCQNDAVVSASAAADGGLSPSMKESAEEHAIAVAAATAAAAEAAVAAAQAAAAVVRLTSCRAAPAYVSGGCAGIREEWAAVRIQSAFRGCLARRALRALKGLVKLQALVRGHIERKRMTEWLHRMHVMMEAQARAIVGRKELQLTNPIPFNHTGPATPEKCEHVIRSRSRKHEQSSLLRRNSSKSNGRANSDDHYKAHSYESQFDEKSGYLRSSSVRNVAITDDEKSDKILEIDTGKPRTIIPKRRNLFHSNDQNSRSFTTSKDSTTHHTLPSPSSCEVQSSLAPLKLEDSLDVEEGSFCTANNSPHFFSASSRGGGGSSRRSPFTPSKSDGSTSFLIGYSDYPNYMSYTESSKAKVRSVSAPKQRPQYERSSSTKRYSIQGIGELKPSGQKSSALHMNFMNKAYPGSGRLDKLGMPIGYRYY